VVRLAPARLPLVVAVGAATVPVVPVPAARRVAEELLEELCLRAELRRFLLVPVLARCFTGVVATGVVVTGAAGVGVGVAAVVVTVADESEEVLGLFLPLSVVAEVRFFTPLFPGCEGTGVGVCTVVTPVESVYGDFLLLSSLGEVVC
jgi:hypothetical protein